MLTRLLLAALLSCSSTLAGSAAAVAAEPVPASCVPGVLPHGALSLICVPAEGWNGDLVVFAHGYVAFDEPLGFYNLDLAEGISLPDLVQGLGFAFATTSYRQNGLAIIEGQEDIRELILAVHLFAPRPPARTFLIGGSEGGIVTTLLLERSPQLFAGGIAACGPIGSFRGQVDYVGDFRVLFDVFFPGTLPGSPTSIPAELITGWESIYVPRVLSALRGNPYATASLIRMSGSAVDPLDASTIETTTVHVLWYNVFGSNDAAAKLGGNPYGNIGRSYSGSGDPLLDALVNERARRIAASPLALLALREYETSGDLTVPMIAPHTTGDEVIPFWQELHYLGKLAPGAPLSLLPVARYGHCRFTAGELMSAFALLLLRAG